MAGRGITSRLRRSPKVETAPEKPARRAEAQFMPRLDDPASEEVRRALVQQIQSLRQRVEDLERDKQSQVTARGGFVPKGYINGLTLSWVSATQITVAAGECTDEEDEVILVLPKTAANLSWEVLDTGSEASSKMYAVYLVAPAAGGNGRIVFSRTFNTSGQFGPTRKAGERYRYIGAFYNNVSSNIQWFTQYGTGRTRYIHYHHHGVLYVVQGLGSSSGAAASLKFAPPSCRLFNAHIFYNPISTGNTVQLYHPDSFNSGGIYDVRISSHNAGGRHYGNYILPTDGASIYYKTDNGSDDVWVYMLGYWDNI